MTQDVLGGGGGGGVVWMFEFACIRFEGLAKGNNDTPGTYIMLMGTFFKISCGKER